MKPWLFLTGLLIVTGCTPQVPAPVPLNPGGKPAGDPAGQNFGASRPAGNPEQPARLFDESILRGREFLLESATPGPMLVRDRLLGPLEDNRGLVQAIEALFRGVIQRNLSNELLVGRWAAYLQGWSRRVQDYGWIEESLRVGKSLPESPEGIMVPVRIENTTDEYRGWVLVVREENRWLVSDVQLIASPRNPEPFDPESGAQEISSPSLR